MSNPPPPWSRRAMAAPDPSTLTASWELQRWERRQTEDDPESSQDHKDARAPNLFALQPMSFTLITGTWQHCWPDPYQFFLCPEITQGGSPKVPQLIWASTLNLRQSGVQINICHLLTPSCPLNSRHLLCFIKILIQNLPCNLYRLAILILIL